MNQNLPSTELLAPAGDGEALRAAVANGADAVYFGLPAFNARRRAANFTLESLDETINLLHRHGVRGYVALNTLILPEELPLAADYVRRIAASGADAVIVQDLGLARLVRQISPTLPLHASTQMTLGEPEAINLAAAGLGLSRIILPRELSINEIRKLRQATAVELEVFVHGALCMSYSGQCLASQWLFGRSANRGACAQPCRLPYALEVDGRQQPDAVNYPLSPYDLAAHSLLPELVRAGVSSLKIEGRLKSPEYVAAVVQLYRAALDAALAGRSYEPTAAQRAAVAGSYSRGFTRGYLGGERHEQIVGGSSSAAQGQRVGTVAGRQGPRLVIQLERESESSGAKAAAGATIDIAPGDGLMIVDPAGNEPPAGGRVYQVEAIPDAAGRRRLAVAFGSDDAALTRAANGAAVYRTDDPQMSRELRKSYSRLTVRRPLPLAVTVRAEVGRPLRLQAEVTAEGRAGHLSASVEGDTPLEEARRHPTTLEAVREQLSRLGDTGYALGPVTLLGQGDDATEVVPAMVPKSLLNDLRRRLVEALDQARAEAERHPIAEPQALEHLLAEVASAGRRAARESAGADRLHLHVLVRSAGQVDAVIAAAEAEASHGVQLAAMVELPQAERAAAVERLKGAGLPVQLVTPRILKLDGRPALERLVDEAPDGLLVRNLGAAAVARQRRPQLPLVADFSLNAANPLTAGWLLEQGLARVTPAAELTPEGLRQLVESVGPQAVELILHRHVPLMHMAHCLAAAWAARTTGRPGCGGVCRQHRIMLRDRIGECLPVLCDENHHNTLFAPLASHAAGGLATALSQGLCHYRIELLGEPAELSRLLLTMHLRWLAAGEAPTDASAELKRLGIRLR